MSLKIFGYTAVHWLDQPVSLWFSPCTEYVYKWIKKSPSSKVCLPRPIPSPLALHVNIFTQRIVDGPLSGRPSCSMDHEKVAPPLLIQVLDEKYFQEPADDMTLLSPQE